METRVARIRVHEIRIGVSSCLLGNKVRYDAGHKKLPYITDIMSPYITLVPVCPEVESGLSVPREAMRLEGDPQRPRLVTTTTGIDLTDTMVGYSGRGIKNLERQELSGFIFKKDSPSCGLYRVKVHSAAGVMRSGAGLFAAAVRERFPLLPVEEDESFSDVAFRDNFIERIFGYQRLQLLMNGTPGMSELVEFHARHKLQIMAHSIKHYREMGRLVAAGKELGRDKLFDAYQRQFMEALSFGATVKKNTNVLMHVVGYFKKSLPAEERQELFTAVSAYHGGLLPLIIPVTLLNHHVRRKKVPYLEGQVYLNPDPRELMLRNHA